MSDPVTAMKQSDGVRLDSPPPLPAEAKRKASSNWAPEPKTEDNQLGAEGANPMIQTLSAMKQVEMGMQKIAALQPSIAQQMTQGLTLFRQLIAQSLVAGAQQGGVGAPSGMMAPPMPMPPMGAGAPGGQMM